MIKRNTIAPTKTFGQIAGISSVAPTERQDADVWINIGYETGDPVYPFVSLPFGIPLDTQKPLAVRGRDQDYLAFTGARNALLEEIQKAAEDLAPGEDIILSPEGSEGGLVIQIRRRSEAAVEAPIENNRFAPKFHIAVPKAA